MKNFIELFEQSAASCPQNIALVCQGSEMTYDELDRMSGSVAAALAAGGVGANDIVPIMLPRGVKAVAALVGVLRAGAAVCFINMDYPRERVEFIRKDTASRLMIDSGFFEGLRPGQAPRVTPRPMDTSVVVYTSGSTGNPKGVMNTHHGLSLALNGSIQAGEPTDSISAAAFSFVAGVLTVLLPLCMGTALHILDDDTRGDVAKILDYCNRNRITNGFLPPQVLSEVLKQPGLPFTQISTGSERVSNIFSKDIRILNCYGASETCAGVLFFEIDKPYENTPVGKALPGSRVYILDDECNELPRGEVGEICVSGQVAKGYINLPELTAERFVGNPFSTDDYDKILYRTNDLGRMLADGNVEFVQRKDWMLKIRGYRVEPGEIEAAITRLTPVDKVAVVGYENAAGQTSLYAAYTAGGDVPPDGIRQAIAGFLPEYMIPSLLVQLDSLPVNANGKIDRKNLAPPDLGKFRAEYIAPENPDEAELCEAFATILGLDRVSAIDDFILLGGDSIAAVRLQGLLGSYSVTDILRLRTPRALAKAKESAVRIPRAADRESWPLTHAEQRMLVEQQMDPQSVAYNVGLAFRLDGVADVPRLEKALRSLVARHRILRSCYPLEGGEFVHRIDENVKVTLQRVSCGYNEVNRQIDSRNTRYDIAAAPLFRFTLFETEDKPVLYLGFHHIVMDGVSGGILATDLWQLYADAELPSARPDYLDWAVWQAGQEQQEDKEKLFLDMFADGVPENEMPTHPVRPDILPYVDSEVRGSMDTAMVEAAARRLGVTPYALLFAVAGAALGKYCGSEDVVLGAAMNGRVQPEAGSMVGMFVNSLPVRVRPEGKKAFSEYLEEVSALLAEVRQNQDHPFDKLVPRLAPDRNASRAPVFDMLVNYLNDMPETEAGGLRIARFPIRRQELPYDFQLEMTRSDEQVTVALSYSKKLYLPEVAENLVEQYLTTLERVCLDASISVMDAAALPEAQEKQILGDFAGYHTDEGLGSTIVDLFRHQAARVPQRPAIRAGEDVLSYAQVDAETDKLAAELQRRGIGRGDRVGVLVGRNEFMPVGALGVLKSGAAYLPMDSSYPAERLEYMLGDADVRLIVADRGLAGVVPGFEGEFLYTDEVSALPVPSEQPAGPEFEDLFVLLYTSGTTGNPKGVMLCHNNLANFCAWYRRFYEVTEEDGVAAYASFGFDACLMDMYPALTSGAAVHIIPAEMRLDLESLNDYFNGNDIRLAFMTTQLGRQFAESMDNHSLRELSVGGETLVPVRPPEGFKLFNVYGPTECTVLVTHFHVDKLYERVPIGRALDNTRFYIVDRHDRLAPVGVAGELCISGRSVAKGYLNRPDITQEKFTPNPFTDEADYARVYRSGDVVRFLPDGNVDFVGRRDFQVKIRGFRVELTEIEGRIREYAAVTDAAVVAWDAPGGGKCAVAYIVSGETVDVENLNGFIEEKLPPYMVPASTMQVGAIPLNPNGKVDRRKLPPPVFGGGDGQEEQGYAQTELGKGVSEVVEEVLGHSEFGATSNLLRAGLTSLSAIKLATLLEKRYGVSLSVKDMLGEPTVLSIENGMVRALLTRGPGEGGEDIPLGPVKLEKINVDDAVSVSELNETELGKHIQTVLAEVLGDVRVGEGDDLTKAGLTSLSTIKLVTRLKKHFGVAPSVHELMEGPTVAKIRAALLREEERKQEQPDEQLEDQAGYPLSGSQLGVYLDCLKRPDALLYNIPFRIDMPEGIDAQRLAGAVDAVIDAHPVVKMHIAGDGEEIQQIPGEAPASTPVLDMGADALDGHMAAFVQPFDLHSGPLYRAEVVRSGGRVILLADFHHIVFDGASLDLFVRALTSAYGGDAPEEELLSGFHYALLEQRREGDAEWQADKDYFDNLLADVEGASEIAGDIPNPSGKVGTPREAVCTVDRQAVEAFCQQHGFTPAGLFFAASAYTVGRWTGGENAALSTISSGRSDLRLQNSFGMFVRTLPLVLRRGEGQSVLSYIRAAQENLRGSIAHELYPYTRIAADHAFFPSIMYACELGIAGSYAIDGKQMEFRPFGLESPKFRISIHIEERQGGIVFAVQYDDAVYSEGMMRRFADTLGCALAEMTARPDAAIASVSIMSPGQRERIQAFNQTDGWLPCGVLHNAFEQVADEVPDTVALVAQEGEYTYRELEAQANRVANGLISRGLQPEDRVAFMLPRTGRVLMSMLGILKAGGCYIPLDTAYPTARIAQIMEDSGAKFLLTTEDYLNVHERSVDIDKLKDGQASARPDAGVQPGGLAYIIYTSGSTGKPKGVMIEHHSIANYVMAHPGNRHVWALVQNARRMMSITTVTFDMFLKESMTMLCNGGTLIFAGEEASHDPVSLAALFGEAKADAFNATPSRMMEYTAYPALLAAIRRLKVVMAGAEKYPAALAERLAGDEGKDMILLNTYGPTETTVSCNAKQVTPGEPVTVGAPLMGVREYIMDSDGNELPIGVVGELWIGGRGVARGYLNLPEQTDAQFVEYNGERVYRSGDRARWTENGEIEILGRSDNQVKLRGLRIELGEVEEALRNVDGVENAVAMIREIGGAEQLCAYYTASKELEPQGIREALAERLAPYMVPSAYTQIDAIPVTANGKTDVKALPRPEMLRAGEFVKPEGDMEQAFSDIFGQVLGMEDVGALDDFFDIGGTSLSVTRVVILAKERGLTGKDGTAVSYGDVFANPTPRSLAQLLEEGASPAQASQDVADYNYAPIDGLLKDNTIRSFQEGRSQKLGNVLLTGATGFLGSHILRSMLDAEDTGTVYCLMRRGNLDSVEKRLRQMMFYYFEDNFDGHIGSKVIAAEGDITDVDSLRKLQEAGIDTVINCAANVSHFSKDDSIYKVNAEGVGNLIEFCRQGGARLVQVSTASIAGFSVDGKPPVSTEMNERMLYFGQNLENQYVYSKFLAERMILEASARRGLNAKIMRVGNLMARNADGEFQINADANSFVGSLRAYKVIGCFPYSSYLHRSELAPIDSTTEAVLQLARTPKECRVFHPFNNYTVFMGDLVSAMKKEGLQIEFVEDDVFMKALGDAMKDKARAELLTNLVAYQNISKGKTVATVPADNTYTTQVLLRKGWRWPETDNEYMHRFLKDLIAMGYFEE